MANIDKTVSELWSGLDSFTLDAQISGHWTRLRRFYEAFGETDQVGFAETYYRVMGDSWVTFDGIIRNTPKQAFITNVLTLGHSVTLGWGKGIRVSDIMTIVDSAFKTIGKNLAEAAAAFQTDAYQKNAYQAQPNIVDGLTILVGTWHRAFSEDLYLKWESQCKGGLSGFMIARDAWNIVRDQIFPEMYRLEQFNRIIDFLKLYGLLYDKILNRIDALVTLPSVSEVDAEYMQYLVRLIGLDLRKVGITEEYKSPKNLEEIRKTVDLWKIRGTPEYAMRTIRVKTGADADYWIPELWVWKLSRQGLLSVNAYIKDRLFWNHHTLVIVVSKDVPGLEDWLYDHIPASVHLHIMIGDVKSKPMTLVPRGHVVSFEDLIAWLVKIANTVVLQDTLARQVFWYRQFGEEVNEIDDTYRRVFWNRKLTELTPLITHGTKKGVSHVIPGDNLTTLDGPKKALNRPPYRETAIGFDAVSIIQRAPTLVNMKLSGNLLLNDGLTIQKLP